MTFETAKEKFSKDFLYDAYMVRGKSKETIAKDLGISQSLLRKLFSFYSLSKTSEQINEQKTKGLRERARSEKATTSSTIKTVDKDYLYDLYITKNTRYEEVAKILGISCYTLDKILKEYNIHKSKKQSHSLGMETKIQEHGSEKAYHEYARKKLEATILSKYSSMDEYYSDIAKKMSSTKEQRYGTSHYYNIESMRDTCLERYGVPAPCMLPQARMHGNDSAPNREFEELLIANGIEYEREFPLGKYSYDFKVGNNLIEINPSSTHNSSYSPFRDREPMNMHYHELKALYAKENDYRCIHVWDWDDKNKIISLLQKREKVNARDCEIISVGQKEAGEYLNRYHLQGYAKDSIRLGLIHNGELVLLMTFGKPRYNKHFEYELIRLCSHCYVVGGAEKVFSHFIKCYSPNSVVSYCDLSKFVGNVYSSLGFIYKEYSISKHWYNPKTGRHITDALLRSRGFDQLFGEKNGKGTSNKDLMLSHGFVEIYDAGQARFEWNKQN